MPITELHELHRRRMGRNLGLGGVLIAVVVLVFALTMVKVTLEGNERDAPAEVGAETQTVAPAAAEGLEGEQP